MSAINKMRINETTYDIEVANIDTQPTANSNNPVKSGGIKTALDGYEACLNSIGLANVGGVLYIAPRTSI